MMRTRLICDDGLRATDQGFSVEIRLPWYRSLPLTSVEIVKVEVDGEVIDTASMVLEVNAQRHRLSDLKKLPDEWWFVLDSGFLHVKRGSLDADSEHEVAVTVALSPPYIKGLRRMTGARKRLGLSG